MKRKLLLTIGLILSLTTYGQIGINSKDPQVTFDISSSATNTQKPDGLLIPRITGNQLTTNNNAYTDAHNSTLVYVTSPVSAPEGKTIDVTSSGFYFFDGPTNKWIKVNVNAANGITNNQGTLELGGKISKPTKITGITSSNNLGFDVTGVNAININQNLLSIDGQNKRVGIGTASPQASLDVQGTLRLSKELNAIEKAGSTATPIIALGDQLKYAPKGSPVTIGGYRPLTEATPFLVTKLPLAATIARIRFIDHVHASNETNHNDHLAYAYGEFVIIATGPHQKLRFVEANIKGYDGKPRTDVTMTATSLTWTGGVMGAIIINLDQTTGALTVRHSTGLHVHSFLFEIFGGM